MPKLYKRLSSDEIVKILLRNHFTIVHQKGSHIKLRYSLPPLAGSVIVPNRREVPQGTLSSIYKQVCGLIDEKLIDNEFKN